MDEERPKVSGIEEQPIPEKMPPQPSDYVYAIDRKGEVMPEPKGFEGPSPRPGGKIPVVFLIALIAIGAVASANVFSLTVLHSELSAVRKELKEVALRVELDVIKEDIRSINDRLRRLDEELSGLRKALGSYATKADLVRELGRIIERIETLQRDVNGLKVDIQGLKQEIQSLKSDVAWLRERVILLGYINSITLTVLPKNVSESLYSIRVYVPARPQQLSDQTFTVQIRLLNGTDGRDISEEPYSIDVEPEAHVKDTPPVRLLKGVYLLEIKVSYGPHELIRFQFFSID